MELALLGQLPASELGSLLARSLDSRSEAVKLGGEKAMW